MLSRLSTKNSFVKPSGSVTVRTARPGALRSGTSSARADVTNPVALAAALHDGGNLGGRDRDDGQVDRVRQLGRRRYTGHAENRGVVGVHSVHGPGESACENVPQHLVTHRTRAVAGADGRDRAALEHPGQSWTDRRHADHPLIARLGSG